MKPSGRESHRRPSRRFATQAAAAAALDREAAERALVGAAEADDIGGLDVEALEYGDDPVEEPPPSKLDLDTYEMQQALVAPQHGLHTTESEKSLVQTVVSGLTKTLDAAEKSLRSEAPQVAVRKNWKLPDFDFRFEPLESGTVLGGLLRRDDPFDAATYDAAPLLPAAALRLDLATALAPPDLSHRPAGARRAPAPVSQVRPATRVYTCPRVFGAGPPIFRRDGHRMRDRLLLSCLGAARAATTRRGTRTSLRATPSRRPGRRPCAASSRSSRPPRYGAT